MATTPIFFSEAEQEAIRRAAFAVWNDCAGDLLQCKADDKGKSIDQVTVSRAEVLEICLDADRALQRLRERARQDHALLTGDFFARFERASYRELCAILKPVFPSARYGT